jgi:diguanylate cyclase (GGDEF)-like protein
MSEESLRLFIAAALAINVLLLGGLLLVWLAGSLGRRGRPGDAGVLRPPGSDVPLLAGQPEGGSDQAMAKAIDPTASGHDRIFRIASWSFLVAAAAIVAVSGMWTAELHRIVGLLAVAGAAILIVHDVLPAGTLRGVRAAVEIAVALVVASLLVALTGGFASPFFFAFPLIVGGGALVLPAGATAGLALLAATAYLVAATLGGGPPPPGAAVTAAVNLTGIAVLAYLAAAVGRQQRWARDAAIRMSSVDSLTGLFSRPYLLAAIGREIARSERTGRGFCLVMLDLDELKSVNDRYGHHVGDAVLRAVADTLHSNIRRIDVAARHSGDEFVALLPETDPTGAWVVAEKIRLALRQRRVPGLAFAPTVSLGVVSYPTDGRSAETLMISADRALYVAKRSGKDRVAGVVSAPGPTPREQPTVPLDRDKAG